MRRFVVPSSVCWLRDGSIRLVVNSERLSEMLKRDGYPAVTSPDPTSDGLIEALIGSPRSPGGAADGSQG